MAQIQQFAANMVNWQVIWRKHMVSYFHETVQMGRIVYGSSCLPSLGNQEIMNLLKKDSLEMFSDKRKCFPLHEAIVNGKLLM